MKISPLAALCWLMLFSTSLLAQEKEVSLESLDLSAASVGWGSLGKGKGASGQPMKMSGQIFGRGVGVHAPSEIFFKLDGGQARFSATVGVDDAPDHDGSVTFQVIADGETVFDSGRMSKGDRPRKVEIDLTGRKVVELRVTDAGDGIDSDHGDWANAMFVVAGAIPESLPAWMTFLPHYQGASAPAADAKLAQTLASPDGKCRAEVVASDGRIWLRVLRHGRAALDASPLGVTVDGRDCGAGVVAGKSQLYSANETYPWLGNQRTLPNHFHGERITMKSGGCKWTLDVRAYDDGVAWRCLIPGLGDRKVTGEATSFVMPAGSAYWTHTNTISYEANFERFEIDDAAPKKPIAMPVTVELPGGGFACYTESDIMHYSGMTFGVNGRMLNGIFEDDPGGWTMNGAFATPWRVVIAVDDLNALVNSSIVQSVCPPPDPKLFPEGILSGWIKPGRSYWTWIFGMWDSAKWDRIMGYVDDAASLNCKYYTIDDPWRDPRSGWHRNGGDEWDSLKEVCDYAATKNVGIVVWQHWKGIRDLKTREEFFENVAKAGAKGVKLDFMESESHEMLAFYRSCLEIAAKHGILVNFHGANKPAGEMRTWPNGLTREGIYGLEQRGNIQPQHWAALPFTRLVAGGGDFTPTGLHPDRLFGCTKALQLASAVIFTSPIEHWADSAEVYLAQPPEVVDFIRTKPTVWDETVVLPGSKIGEVAAFARRSGDRWWIGILNGTEQSRTLDLNLDFLGEGTRETVAFEDGDSPRQLKVLKGTAKRGDVRSARMSGHGGFVMILGAAK